MKCRKCGTWMKIKGRPQVHKDYIVYNWECGNCGNKTRTREDK